MPEIMRKKFRDVRVCTPVSDGYVIKLSENQGIDLLLEGETTDLNYTDKSAYKIQIVSDFLFLSNVEVVSGKTLYKIQQYYDLTDFETDSIVFLGNITVAGFKACIFLNREGDDKSDSLIVFNALNAYLHLKKDYTIKYIVKHTHDLKLCMKSAYLSFSKCQSQLNSLDEIPLNPFLPVGFIRPETEIYTYDYNLLLKTSSFVNNKLHDLAFTFKNGTTMVTSYLSVLMTSRNKKIEDAIGTTHPERFCDKRNRVLINPSMEDRIYLRYYNEHHIIEIVSPCYFYPQVDSQVKWETNVEGPEKIKVTELDPAEISVNDKKCVVYRFKVELKVSRVKNGSLAGAVSFMATSKLVSYIRRVNVYYGSDDKKNDNDIYGQLIDLIEIGCTLKDDVQTTKLKEPVKPYSLMQPPFTPSSNVCGGVRSHVVYKPSGSKETCLEEPKYKRTEQTLALGDVLTVRFEILDDMIWTYNIIQFTPVIECTHFDIVTEDKRRFCKFKFKLVKRFISSRVGMIYAGAIKFVCGGDLEFPLEAHTKYVMINVDNSCRFESFNEKPRFPPMARLQLKKTEYTPEIEFGQNKIKLVKWIDKHNLLISSLDEVIVKTPDKVCINGEDHPNKWHVGLNQTVIPQALMEELRTKYPSVDPLNYWYGNVNLDSVNKDGQLELKSLQSYNNGLYTFVKKIAELHKRSCPQVAYLYFRNRPVFTHSGHQNGTYVSLNGTVEKTLCILYKPDYDLDYKKPLVELHEYDFPNDLDSIYIKADHNLDVIYPIISNVSLCLFPEWLDLVQVMIKTVGNAGHRVYRFAIRKDKCQVDNMDGWIVFRGADQKHIRLKVFALT